MNNKETLSEEKVKTKRGGARKNSGQKPKYGTPLTYQIRVTKEEKEFIAYVRENHLDYQTFMTNE